MLAKLIVWGENRSVAIERLARALQDFEIGGIRANVPLLLWIANDEAFRNGQTTTQFLAERLDESIFAKKREIAPGELANAAALLLRERRAPWRIGGVGIPLRVEIDGREAVMEATATSDPNVWRIGGDYNGEVRLDKAFADTATVRFADPPDIDTTAHGAHGGANGRITSPMPGKIVKIAVADGDDVETHDLLIVLEAMKMEHRIEAPGDGTVRAIHVREGDIVAGDALLLELQ
jgi:3-methylcrotonyl-CoA carboxylase alpha subunit